MPLKAIGNLCIRSRFMFEIAESRHSRLQLSTWLRKMRCFSLKAVLSLALKG